MDLYDSILEKQTLMMDAYRDFRDLCDQLKSERGTGHNDWENPYEASPSLPDYSMEDDEGSVDEELYDSKEAYEPDEFPMPRSFSYRNIDPNDPAFWSGKSIGIPDALLVRTSESDGDLLPIINGKFRTYGI